jgi:predicted dehydrogenase
VRFGVGVVGVGDVAQRDYLPELHRLDGRVTLAVACGRTPERARAVAERWGCRWTTSYAEVAEAPDVQIVLNLTPGPVHAAVTLAALRAGKSVYTEKPLAQTRSDVAAIAREAERQPGAVVVAAPCVLLFPQVRRLQALFDDGVLGAVHSARGLAFGGVPPWPGFVSDPQPYFVEGSGPLLDMAVYPLHALTGLVGPVRRVAAFSSRTRESFVVEEGPYAGRRVRVDVDDDWHLLLELANGTLAQVQANFSGAGALAPEFELHGERGVAGISLLDGSAPIQLVVDGEARSLPVEHVRESGPDHLLGVEHLVDCLERGTPPVLSVEHAAHVLDILFAAARSGREGHAVDIGSTFTRQPAPAAQEVGT